MSKLGIYSIIPNYVLYDRVVKPQAKLLYGSLTSLCNTKGYCVVTNAYLSDLFGVTTRSIQLYLGELESRGYIEVEILRKENQQVEERKIWISEIKRSLDSLVSNPNQNLVVHDLED
jgi:Helix-turn-helix domain